MISRWSVTILSIILLILGAIYAPYKTSSTPIYSGTLHPLNTDKYGTSEFLSLLESKGVNIYMGGLDNLSEDIELLVILGPDREYTVEESIAILEFIVRGGRVLYVDEFNTPPFLSGLRIQIFPSTLFSNITGWDVVSTGFCKPCNTTYPLDIFGLLNVFGPLDARRYVDSGYQVVYQGNVYTGREIIIEYVVRPIEIGFNKSITIDIYISGPPNIDADAFQRLNENLRRLISLQLNTFAFAEVGEGRLVVISDTAPFINHYIRRGESTGLIEYVLNYLLDGVEDPDVLIDTSKIVTLDQRIRLPHIGRIILETLEFYIENMEVFYISTIEAGSEYLPIGIAVATLSVAIGLRKRLRIPDEYGIYPGDVVETDSPIEISYDWDLSTMSREEMIEFIRRLETSISELGIENGDEYVRRLEAVRRRLGRRFPPYPLSLARRRTMNILLQLYSNLLEGR